MKKSPLKKSKIRIQKSLNPALQASIKRGLAQIERGEFTPHSQVMKRLKEKYKPCILSEEQKSRIERAKNEIKEGKVISNEEANRQVKEWLKK